ncbi:MAG: hypothetical protein ACRD7E_28245, partial [Bryobacteraceae bacterium]
VEREVQTRVAAARTAFSGLMEQLPENERSRVASALEAGYSLEATEGETSTAKPCPACGENGTYVGRVETDFEVDAEDEDGDLVQYGHATHTFYPNTFFCATCRLHLWDRYELRAADVADSWNLEDYEVDPDGEEHERAMDANR